MAAKIFPAARIRLLEIWDYTERKWGDEQADKYVRELVETINALGQQRSKWKAVRDDALPGVYFLLCRHHYLFFREFSSGNLGVISILHAKMDLPARLREDAEKAED